MKSKTTKAAGKASLDPLVRRWWYTARVKNSAGMHSVFYSTTRPVVGATCPGIAAPNRITGYWRDLAPNDQAETSERSEV